MSKQNNTSWDKQKYIIITKYENTQLYCSMEMEANRVTSIKTKLTIHNDYTDVFIGIGYFKGTFSLQIKDNAKTYKMLPRHVAHALQEPFRKELERQ